MGRVVGGALVEKEISTEFNQKNTLYLALNSPDFTTASRVVLAINTKLFDQAAKAPDAGTIEIKIPEQYLGKVVQFVTQIENLVVTPDTSSKVVINERTGTVVMGDNVRISTIAIAHGNLSIQI